MSKKHKCGCTVCSPPRGLDSCGFERSYSAAQEELAKVKVCAEIDGKALADLQAEVTRLKAELENSVKRNNSMYAQLRILRICPDCSVDEGVKHHDECRLLKLFKDRDLWKAQAERYREKLNQLVLCIDSLRDGGDVLPILDGPELRELEDACLEAKSALAEGEK